MNSKLECGDFKWIFRNISLWRFQMDFRNISLWRFQMDFLKYFIVVISGGFFEMFHYKESPVLLPLKKLLHTFDDV